MNAQLDEAAVAIVGGGVLGLSLAYNLARLGKTDICVVEKSHLNAGASARNGGGVRQQWSTAENIAWMKESVRLFRRMPRDLGINIWWVETGYLFLAYTSAQKAGLEKNARLQNEHGIHTRILGPAEIRHLAPELNVEGVLCGAYNPTDGHLFPFPVLWGYANAARRMGARIHTFAEVTGIEAAGGRLTELITTKGRIAADTIVNAAGAWSPTIASLADVDLPNRPETHEILVTESLAPFVEPAVVPMDSGLYCSQTARGELVACVGLHERPVEGDGTTFAFAQYIAKLLTRLFPRLKDVAVLRHWSGFYDTTPDTKPILGPVERFENFIQLSGFMGHGFMMAPFVGKMMAEYLVAGKHRELVESHRVERFRTGGFEKESMIIG